MKVQLQLSKSRGKLSAGLYNLKLISATLDEETGIISVSGIPERITFRHQKEIVKNDE